MKKIFLLLMISSQMTLVSYAKDREEIVFQSARPWRTARFYAVGQWDAESKKTVWISSTAGASSIQFNDSKCKNAKDLIFADLSFVPESEKFKQEFLAAEPKSQSGTSREIIRSKGQWFAIEVQSEVDTDQIYLNFKSAQIGARCEGRVKLTYSWGAVKSGVRPLLMLGPDKNLHSTYVIRFDVPQLRLGRVGIVLDLIGGYWKANYPQASANANGRVTYFPVTMARGEWFIPQHQRLGLHITLEQAAAVHGRKAGQSVFVSDWQAGTFYDVVVPLADSWVNRFALYYRGHLTDDSLLVPTVDPANKDSKYVVLQGASHLYFGRIFLAGAEYSWAPMTHIAGHGVGQGYAEFLGRVGVRLNSSVYFITELGYRAYRIEGRSTESITFWNGGFRLRL